jgi:hypothetical protein
MPQGDRSRGSVSSVAGIGEGGAVTGGLLAVGAGIAGRTTGGGGVSGLTGVVTAAGALAGAAVLVGAPVVVCALALNGSTTYAANISPANAAAPVLRRIDGIILLIWSGIPCC